MTRQRRELAPRRARSAARRLRDLVPSSAGKEDTHLEQADRPIRHDSPRRHAGRGNVPVRGREGPRRPCARPPRHPVHRGRLPELQPQGGGALRAARSRALRQLRDLRLRHDPPARPRGATRIRRCVLLARFLRARLHAGRQDVEAAPREGDPHRSGREPRPDPRLRRVPGLAGQARDLRRRALLRRVSATTPTTRCAAWRSRSRPAPRT